MFDATASTDRLIELILQEDKDVLKQLLTTDKVVATKADNVYFGKRRSKEERAASVAAAKKAEAGAKAAELKAGRVAELEAWLKANPRSKRTRRRSSQQQRSAKQSRSVNHSVTEANLSGPKIYARVSRRSFGNGSMKPERILATAPEGQRLGILTHPSWLVSHSDAMDNHAIRRGRWIRERLLGGGIPDVPITVDAMLPDEPHNTLRERMRVTRETYCWTCHKKMDPLGLPFEMYNHAGLYRETELDKPVDTTGEIIDSGDPDARRQSRQRHRDDSEARGKQTRRTGLRPPRLPFLDGPQRNPQRRSRSSGSVSRLQRQRRQHESAAHIAAHVRCVSLPHKE